MKKKNTLFHLSVCCVNGIFFLSFFSFHSIFSSLSEFKQKRTHYMDWGLVISPHAQSTIRKIVNVKKTRPFLFPENGASSSLLCYYTSLKPFKHPTVIFLSLLLPSINSFVEFLFKNITWHFLVELEQKHFFSLICFVLFTSSTLKCE